MFSRFYILIIMGNPSLAQYIFIVFTVILSLFIITSILLTYGLSALFSELEDIRLQNAITLIYIALILIVASPFIPFFGFTLTIWGSILFFLVLGLLIAGIGRNYYDNLLMTMGVIIAVFSLFILLPPTFAFIAVLIFVSAFRVEEGVSKFLLRGNVDKMFESIESELLEICREERIVKLSTIGLKYLIPRSLLVNMLMRIKGKMELDIYIISGNILCKKLI
ncbi:MAG: hypothetical protein ACP6IP_10765 [Candidatus Njordarchaeia archaeon]